MSIPPIDSSDRPQPQPIPRENTSTPTPLQNVKLPQELITDSSIISLTAVAAAFTDKKNYEGEAAQPKLPNPTDGNNPSPIEPAAQNIVSGFISKQITMLLADVSSPNDSADIFNHLIEGTPLQNPKLKQQASQIKNSIEESVRQETKLENFSLDALYQPKKEAWIRTPIQAYTDGQKKEIHADFEIARKISLNEFIQVNPDLDIETITLLKMALEGVKVDPSIKFALTQIDAKAIPVIQEKYGLPISWTPGTTETDKWKPVNKSIINPRSVGEARQALISKNTETVATNFLDVIIEALYSQRETLNQELLMHSELALSNMNFKRDDQVQSNKLSEKKLEEVTKSQSKSHKLAVFSKVMMAVGAAISVISMIVTIATAGLLSPLAVAALTVTGAMLTYSVVDATTGVTAKVFEEINKVFDDLTAGLTDAGAAALKLAAVVLVVTLVVIAVIATAPAGGSAGTSMATKALTLGLAKTIVIEGTQMAARQLAVQLTLIMLMGSGVLMEFPSEILKLTGMNENSRQVFQMLIFLMEMAVIMVVATKATASITESGSAPVPAGTDKMTLTDTLKNTSTAIKTDLGETLKSSKKMIEDTLNAIRNPGNPITGLKSSFSKAKDALKLLKQLETEQVISRLPMAIDRTFKLVNIGTGVVTHAVEAYYQFLIFAVYKDLSMTEQAEAELKALISVLDNAIEQLQAQATGASDMSTSFAQSITALLNSISTSSNKLFNTLQG